MESELPESRKQVLSKRNYKDDIIDSVKELDIENINFSTKKERDTTVRVIESQKTFFWIRLYLKESYDFLNANDDITIKYTNNGENLSIKYICYAKQGLDKDKEEDILNYNPEDDKKILCLMIDGDRVNKNSKDIPFLRSMFKISKYYEYQLVKRDEIQFIHEPTGTVLDYYNVNW